MLNRKTETIRTRSGRLSKTTSIAVEAVWNLR